MPRFEVVLSDEERALLKRRAHRAEMSMAELVRSVLFPSVPEGSMLSVKEAKVFAEAVLAVPVEKPPVTRMPAKARPAPVAGGCVHKNVRWAPTAGLEVCDDCGVSRKRGAAWPEQPIEGEA